MYKILVNMFIIAVASAMNLTLTKWFVSYEVIGVNGGIYAASIISIASAILIFALVSPRRVTREVNFHIHQCCEVENTGAPGPEEKKHEMPGVGSKECVDNLKEMGNAMYRADKKAGKPAKRAKSKARSESAKKRPRTKNGRFA